MTMLFACMRVCRRNSSSPPAPVVKAKGKECRSFFGRVPLRLPQDETDATKDNTCAAVVDLEDCCKMTVCHKVQYNLTVDD